MLSAAKQLTRLRLRAAPASHLCRRQLHLQQAVALNLLAAQGIPVHPYELLYSPVDSKRAFKNLGRRPVEIWAQLTDAAGVAALRNGTFGSLEGVRFDALTEAELTAVVGAVLATPFRLASAPTGMQERACEAVLVAPKPELEKTVRVLFYLDRTKENGGTAVLAARAKDVDNFASLRVFAEGNPSKVAVAGVSCADGLSFDQAEAILRQLNFSKYDSIVNEAAVILVKLYEEAFVGKDALRIEVWLSPNHQRDVVVVDARIELDDFAAPRQDRANLSSGVQVHPSELEAAKSGLFYIKPPVTPTQPRGNIGCFGYGAGLAMATMDAVVDAGGAPANFLDGGGGATAANAKVSIELLAKDPDVKVIFVNIFGGITQTDKVAAGIIDAVKGTPRLAKGEVPMVVRIRGTGEVEAKKLLAESGIPFILEDDFGLAAQAAVNAAL